jgi:serine/threonine protein kinase
VSVVLLDHAGHCRLSDLGLAVVTKVKIKGYAGTPGYCFTAEDHELLTGRGFMSLSEVEAHFEHHAALDVACWVDGKQEFHPITADKLTVAEDTLDLVTFENEDHDVSIRVTAGHRMFGRLGSVTVQTDGSMPWFDGEAPSMLAHTAREVVDSALDAPAVFQVATSFPLGGAVTESELPFVQTLGQRFADGTEAEKAVHGGAIYTSSVGHRDELVRLCLAAGYTAFYQMDKPAGTVTDNNAQGKPITLQRPSWCVRYTVHTHQTEPKLLVKRDTQLAEGVPTKVWCVTVPSKDNLIMVRRVVERDAAGQPTKVSRPIVIGNTAPEMIKNKLYGPAADIFSYGVMLYRMLCGSKPFKGKVDRDLDKAVIERKPQFPKEIFSKEAISLLTGLLQKRPENRLGCGEKGIEEIKSHPFFEVILRLSSLRGAHML